MEHEGNFDWIKECERLVAINEKLLEACKTIISDAIWNGKIRGPIELEYLIKESTLEKVRQAIAKAEGRDT